MSETTAPTVTPRAPLWMLALITLSGTMAMHIFVPAVPAAAREFHVGIATAELTLSAYIIGLSLGQLTYGPVSDHFGRRPVLMVGLAVYALSGLAAMLAPNMNALIAARFFQALGGCSGLVLGRAIVRDSAGGAEAARRLSLMNLMVMVGPGLSPLAGAALSSASGWRSIFTVLTGLGVCNLLLVWRRLPETAHRAGHGMRRVMRGYGRLARSARFLAYACGGGFATTSMYAFIGAAPFIIGGQMGRPAHEVGVYLALDMGGVWLGSLTASRLLGYVPMRRMMVLGNLASCLSAGAFLFAVVSGHMSVVTIIGPMLVLSYGAGVASPAALAEALSIDPAAAGSASGLYGFAQMAIGAVCAALAGVGHNPALAVGSILLTAGVLAQAAFWFARPRDA